MALNPGTRLGPYEILSPLGAGGMGEVYRARDTRLLRDVAVKVLPPHLSSNPEVRARFEREAKAVSSLNHPHICTLFDVGREGDTDFLVMELIEGETLARRLEKGPLSTEQVTTLGAQIADALARAHRAGIIHRDLKPGNVMLTKSGAKLMDFGLARAAGPAGRSGSEASIEAFTQSPTMAQPLTSEGTIVGTFQYMSPEQLEGKEADARSDVWALGCVLYEMATGKRAFEGKSQASLIVAIMEKPVVSLADLAPASPPALDRLVQACLAKDPEDRVQTAHDARLQLQWIRSETTSATGAAALPARNGSRRARRAVAALLVVAAIAAAFVAGRQSAPRTTSNAFQFQRKTYRAQAIFSARFMPDGKAMVLSSALDGNTTELFVIRPEYPEPQPLGMKNVHLLAVSSRGELAVLNRARFIGHHRLFSGTLARMPLEGAAPREIMEGVREADWGSDGENLAVIHELDEKDRLEFPIGKVLYESAGYLSDVRVSPRGDRIAFMEHPSKYDDRGSVNVVDLDGHARVLMGGYWGMEGLAWSRDNAAVFFSATTNGTDYSVYRVDLDGHAGPAGQSAGGLTIHDIAHDGTWAVTRDEYPVRLVFHAPGSTEDVDLSWLDNGIDPFLSADGKTVTFTDQSEGAGPNYAVAVRPTSGGAIVRLGEGHGMGFSPDGKSVLAFVPVTPCRLMSYPVGAGQPVRLDHGGFENISSARWMKDGSHVLVSGNEAGKPPRCFLLEVSSGKSEPVGPEGIGRGCPSPDGTAFIARSQSGWVIFPMSGSGEGRPFPSLTLKDYVIRWNLDGSAIYCYQRASIPGSIDRIDVKTGRRETTPLLAGAGTGALSILSVSIADDLRAVVYGSWSYTSVLYTVAGER